MLCTFTTNILHRRSSYNWNMLPSFFCWSFYQIIQRQISYKRDIKMGRQDQQSDSQRRKQKKLKKEKKDKKDKKDKKQKNQKKQKKQKHKHKHERQSHQRQQKREVHQPKQQKFTIKPVFMQKKEQQQAQFTGQPRTHIPCRRCKQMTFSLKTRSCSACGYPKQQRPAYFPVQKEQNVYDMIRDGKLVHNSYAPVLIEVTVNDRFGKKQRIKCSPIDSVLDLKKLISAQIGTRPEKIRLQKANIIYKDHISLQDYEIKDGSGLQMYYD